MASQHPAEWKPLLRGQPHHRAVGPHCSALLLQVSWPSPPPSLTTDLLCLLCLPAVITASQLALAPQTPAERSTACLTSEVPGQAWRPVPAKAGRLLPHPSPGPDPSSHTSNPGHSLFQLGLWLQMSPRTGVECPFLLLIMLSLTKGPGHPSLLPHCKPRGP